MLGLRAYPFHAGELDQLPPLGRGLVLDFSCFALSRNPKSDTECYNNHNYDFRRFGGPKDPLAGDRYPEKVGFFV